MVYWTILDEIISTPVPELETNPFQYVSLNTDRLQTTPTTKEIFTYKFRLTSNTTSITLVIAIELHLIT
ncbi:hypothetical protein D3C84_1190180 [compost metagenome]